MMKKTLVVGISGGSGSGKSTLVTELLKKFEPSTVSVLSLDSYYFDQSHLPDEDREKLNFDHPDAFENDLLEKHLKQLVTGNTVHVPVYDFFTHTRQPFTCPVHPNDVVLVEGIYILYNEKINNLLDARIFIDTDDDERFIRRMTRDVRDTEDGLWTQSFSSICQLSSQCI